MDLSKSLKKLKSFWKKDELEEGTENQGIHLPQITGILIALLLLGFVFSILSPVFFSKTNITNILLQSALTMVIATGATIVIASAGIDLSVGSVIAFSGIIMAMTLKAEMPVWLCITLGILAGTAIGAINGLMVGKIKITPFIATLAMMSVARAISYIITDARPIYGLPAKFRYFGTGSIGPIPVPTIIAISIALIGHFILERTRAGRNSLAIGGNEEAARLSGVNIPRAQLIIYSLAGAAYAIGALITTARLNAAEPMAGLGLEMDAIAAAVIGGTSLAGGVASILGTVIGALIMATLRNGLTLLSVQPYFQQLTIGIVIVAAVFIDKIRSR